MEKIGSGMGEGTVLYKGLRKGLISKGPSEQRSEGSEGVGPVNMLGKRIANRENNKHKGPGVSSQKSRGVNVSG